MKDEPYRILAVDDEAFNLDIISEYLEEDGYDILTATNGVEALEVMLTCKKLHAIVLDRMMPEMDGLTFMTKLTEHPRHEHVPVILQTAAATNKEIKEGIDAGAYYYLTKPYEKEVFLSIVRSAIHENSVLANAREALAGTQQLMGLMSEATLHFQTFEDVQLLAPVIANAFPDPERVLLGLNEVMVNAVEHGNLGITHEEKHTLIQQGTWLSEITRRQTLPEYCNKSARLHYQKTEKDIVIHVIDEGEGFDHSDFTSIDPSRMTQANGRGIALARLLSFDNLEYLGKGNEVRCTMALPKGGEMQNDAFVFSA